MQNDAIYIQTIVDAVSFGGTAEPATELAAEYVGGGRKIIFVFGRNMTKRCFIKEVS